MGSNRGPYEHDYDGRPLVGWDDLLLAALMREHGTKEQQERHRLSGEQRTDATPLTAV
jgi:hypothetical protein